MMRAILVLMASVLTLASAQGYQAEMAVRGRVRFGPSTKAPTVTTLTPGTKVTILRPAEGVQGWYEVQFPRQGHAWVHKKVLAPTADSRRFRVIVDKANVRDDSRINANLVTQLALNEEVEWVGREIDGTFLGRKVGVVVCHLSRFSRRLRPPFGAAPQCRRSKSD